MKVITPVGTSIFTNYLKDCANNAYENLKEFFHYEWDTYKRDRDDLRSAVNEWVNCKRQNGKFEECSAEIKSLHKLLVELKDNLEVYLIATDTVVARLAAELLVELLNNYKSLGGHTITVHFNSAQDVIKGLQVKKRADFEKEGMVNLINRIFQITGGYYANTILNITGGYKATIPYLTIMGQINNMPLYYIFEDTNELIRIPQAPLSINLAVFEKYWDQFGLLDGGAIVPKLTFQNGFLDEAGSCLEIDGADVVLNPLGTIFWIRYKSDYFLFYASDDVWHELEKQQHCMKILTEKFFDPVRRKTEMKNGHTVHDDGRNTLRIYYFETEGKIYIYKSFENYDDHNRYWRNTSFENAIKIDAISKAKLKRVKITR